MKKIYQGLEIELIFFKEDIVTLSKDNVGNDPFEDEW